jgi:DNA replication protein DnaC
MEKLGEVISKLRSEGTGIERFYRDYSKKVARKIWLEMYEALIDCEVETQKYWNELILWAMADKACNLDLLKGIGIVGATGIGKTSAMKVLNSMLEYDNCVYLKNGRPIPLKFHIYNSREIVSRYEKDGHEGLYNYYNYANVMIDDLGTELLQAKHYGTPLNVLEEVIERRYENNMMLHFTSNLSLNDIHEKYGDRVYSRINQQVNIIELEGKDFRLK